MQKVRKAQNTRAQNTHKKRRPPFLHLKAWHLGLETENNVQLNDDAKSQKELSLENLKSAFDYLKNG